MMSSRRWPSCRFYIINQSPDLALYDDGYFFITDRKKDLIIKGGENISPRAIEEVLYAHPAVSEAAGIGVKDPLYGENIKAFALLKPGESASGEDILDFCKDRLKRFFVPKEVTIINAMPKSLVGKILKKELRVMDGGWRKVKGER